MFTVILVGLFAAAFVLVGLLNRWSGQLDARLRKRHPETLEALRQEDQSYGGADESSYALLKYLWQRKYLGLRDETTARIASRLRMLLFAFPLLFVAMGIVSLLAEEAGELRIVSGRNLPPSAAGKDAGNPTAGKREQALELHRQGRPEDAIRLYDELLGSEGKDAELVYWRGVAHWKAGSEDKALADFRYLMDLDPGRFDAYLHADRILSRQRRFDDCVDLWTRYLRVAPNDATAYMERGGSHFHRGDFAAAHADARRACELGKTEACAHAERMKARL